MTLTPNDIIKDDIWYRQFPNNPAELIHQNNAVRKELASKVADELEMYSGETPNAYMKRMRELIKTLRVEYQRDKGEKMKLDIQRTHARVQLNFILKQFIETHESLDEIYFSEIQIAKSLLHQIWKEVESQEGKR